MPYFKYAAQNPEGKRIKGTIEAESSNKIAEMLQEMGYTPLSISPAEATTKKLYYVGKDRNGKTVEGVIKATGIHEATRQLHDMGLMEFRFSQQKNLDAHYDDTPVDKASKQMAKLFIFILFGAVAVFSMVFPHAIEAYMLGETRSQLTNANILELPENSGLLKYSFEARGKTYTKFNRLKTKHIETPKLGDVVQVRYSTHFPSISRLADTVPKMSNNVRNALCISGLIIILMVLGLIWCSSFHYIGRILQARREMKPVPENDVKRLLANTASALLFPVVFATMFTTMMGQGEASFYHPYRYYIIGCSILMLALIIIIKRKGPVYYD